MTQDIYDRLCIRADIRQNATSRKSVQEGKPDRLAALLLEAAAEIQLLRNEVQRLAEDAAGESL